MNQAIETFKEQIKESQHIVFFGGAGVSTASGIPDFRSSNGLFVKSLGTHYSAEEVVSHDFFMNHPKEYFDFHFKYLVYTKAKPNKAHHYLSELENQGKDVTIITQNIDGLHQMAGSKHVLELHGTVLDNYCLTCKKHYSIEELERDVDGIPRCNIDQGIVRPNIVLYQEGLNQKVIQQSVEALSKADMLIVAGTSLVVYPAAGLINYYQGNRFVVINKSKIQTGRLKGLVFNESIIDVFDQLS